MNYNSSLPSANAFQFQLPSTHVQNEKPLRSIFIFDSHRLVCASFLHFWLQLEKLSADVITFNSLGILRQEQRDMRIFIAAWYR